MELDDDDFGLDEIRGMAETHIPVELSDSPYALPKEFLSYSQVRLWQTCGERYRRQYVYDERSPRSSNLSHGSLVHKLVETMLLHKMDTGDLLPLEAVNDMITDALPEEAVKTQVWDPKIPDLETLETSARALTELYYQERYPEVQPRGVEVPVRGMINGRVRFQGWVDLVEANPMNPQVYPVDPVDRPVPQPGDSLKDLKVTGRKYGPQRVENAMQLTVYADLLGLDEVGYDLLVETPKTRKRSFVSQISSRSADEKAHVADVIEDVTQAISAGVFPKTDPESWACSEKWCPYWSSCRGKKR